jgi:hypothetical protein
MRAPWALALALILGFSACGGEEGDDGKPTKPPPPGELPPQGIYEAKPPGYGGDRLARIADAGFELVLNYEAWDGTDSEILEYASRAEAEGVKLIWPLNDRSWNSDAELVRRRVQLVHRHPATWGFYVGDEVPPSDENVAAVNTLTNRVAAAGSTRPNLIVQLPEPGDDPAYNLRPFADGVSGLTHAGLDPYPVVDDNSLDRIGSRVRQVSAESQRAGGRRGRKPVMVLQAFSWHRYLDRQVRWPTYREMRLMRDSALEGNPRFILWYSYHDALRKEGQFERLRDAALGGEATREQPLSLLRAR